MTTPGFISKQLNQILVYWGNPKQKGTGGFTYDDPVEIKGRVEIKTQLVVSLGGEAKLSKANVLVRQVVDEGSYLYLGSLDDSDFGLDQLPNSTEGAMQVLAFEKIPSVSGSTSLYKAYLNKM